MPRRGENIRKRADGRWEARYIRTYQPDGKAHYGYLYASTYTAVKKKKQEALSAISSHRILCKESPKVFSEILELWLQNRQESVKQSTYCQYATIIHRHLVPAFNTVKLDTFSNAVVEQYIRDKRQNGRLDGKGGLSQKTISDHIVVIKQALRFAVASDWMPEGTFAFHVSTPKACKPELLPELDWLRLNRGIRTPQNGCMLGILIAMHTGLRIGEICALRFSDVDLESGVLSVNRTALRIKNMEPNARSKTKVVLGAPKTEHSLRKIPLPAFILPILRQNLYRASDKDAFIVSGTANCIEPRVFYRQYQSVLKQCGIKQYTFHALRHTFATKCIENGCDPKTLSELLGHSNVKITLERYVHPSMNTKRAALERLANLDLWSTEMVSCG